MKYLQLQLLCVHMYMYMCTHVYVFIMYTCRTRVHNGYILNQLDRLEFDFFDHTSRVHYY